MTKKILNIIIIALTVTIVLYFAVKICYDGLVIQDADNKYHKASTPAITYTIH